MNELKLGVGLAHELEITARKAGWTIEDFVRLAQSETVSKDVLAVIRGNAEIQILTHIIDCSVQPMIPEGWSIHEEDQIASRFQGELIWDAAKIGLHLDEAQTKGSIVGDDLLKKLDGQPVLPVNVGDYLLNHPALIPLDWKGKAIFFWGTVYRGSDGHLFVRCLSWADRRWLWSSYWLGYGWFGQRPAAVLAG